MARILFSSLALLNQDETNFVALTGSQLASRDNSFVFMSPHHHAALAACTVRIPNRLCDWSHFFPAEATVKNEAMSRIDVPLWIRRIQYSDGAVDGSYDCLPLLESLAGAALMLLRSLEPHVVVAWNPADPTLGVLAEIAKSLGSEVWGSERGHLPGTFVVDRQISGIWQSVNSESLEVEISRRDLAELGSEFLRSAYSDRFLRYPVDGQRTSGRFDLGAVQGTPKVLVIGCFDAAIGLMPADPKRSQDLPHYDSGFDIVRHVATAHVGVTVFKPHPCMGGWRFTYDCRPLPNVVIGDGDIRDYIDWADVVVGYGSSLDFAAINAGKPLVLCGRSPLWRKGIAYEALAPTELSDAIQSALQKEHWEARSNRFASLVGYLVSQRWLRIDTEQHRMVAARECAELVASAHPSSSDETDLTRRLEGLAFSGHADRNIAYAPKNPVSLLDQAEDAQRQAEDAQRQAEDAQRQAEDELRRLNNSLTLRIVRPFHRLLDVVRHQLPTAQRRSRRTNLSRGHAVSRHESTTGLEHATQRLHKADDVFATERQYLASRYPSIDSEMEANRREFLTASPESRGHTAYRTYGQLILGPPLAAFGAWVVLQCKARRIDRVYCVLREGRFLSELLAVAQGAVGYQLDIRTLFASRFCLRSASLASGSQREMMDFCSGVRPADLQPDLLEYVGLFEKADTATWLALGIGERDPAARLDYIREVYRESEEAALRISALAKTRKQGLLTYLNRCDIPRSSDFVVVDLGWGGTMQAALVPFLRELGIDSVVRGFYLGTDARIASLSKATCPWHSFLYSVGKPGRHAALIRRTPELLEQCCMAPTGSLKEFRPDGSPELFPNRLPTLQLEQTAEVQRGILDYAMRWLPRLFADTDAHDALASLDHLSPVLRAIVSRSIDCPTPEEAALFAHWQHDSNNGSDGCQRIIGTPDAARGVRTGRFIHPDELDWLASYWPQGLFTHLGIAWSRKHWSGGLRSTIEKVQTVLMRS